jgi:hypothetical protein
MDMKNFAQYLQNKSFDEELHKVRKQSLERINANESSIVAILESKIYLGRPHGEQ